MRIQIASTQYDLKKSSIEDFFKRTQILIEKAAHQKAEVMVLPEYFSMAFLLDHAGGDFKKALRCFHEVEEKFHQHFQKLSKKHQMLICAGTVPFVFAGKIVNRSLIYTPDGVIRHQDKLNMTRFENEEWHVSPGLDEYLVFEWKSIRFGVAICYDVEFPNYVKKLIDKNVDVVLVPSCTDDVHGYWRVRLCAQARAVEGQVYVVSSGIVGGDSRFPIEIGSHYGQAGFFTPSDIGFPEGGVLKLGEINQEDVHTAAFDVELLRKLHKNATVFRST